MAQYKYIMTARNDTEHMASCTQYKWSDVLPIVIRWFGRGYSVTVKREKMK